MSKIYVHEGLEVKLTGRQARKELRSGKVSIVYEIAPADSESISFKKWVHMKELFEILEDE
jgi:hypothetical protein